MWLSLFMTREQMSARFNTQFSVSFLSAITALDFQDSISLDSEWGQCALGPSADRRWPWSLSKKYMYGVWSRDIELFVFTAQSRISWLLHYLYCVFLWQVLENVYYTCFWMHVFHVLQVNCHPWQRGAILWTHRVNAFYFLFLV